MMIYERDIITYRSSSLVISDVQRLVLSRDIGACDSLNEHRRRLYTIDSITKFYYMTDSIT
jgi:hypothetical protein